MPEDRVVRLWCEGCDDGVLLAVRYKSENWLVYPQEEIVDWLKVHSEHKEGFDLSFGPFRCRPPREPDA